MLRLLQFLLHSRLTFGLRAFLAGKCFSTVPLAFGEDDDEARRREACESLPGPQRAGPTPSTSGKRFGFQAHACVGIQRGALPGEREGLALGPGRARVGVILSSKERKE